jgi:hypothetical protein
MTRYMSKHTRMMQKDDIRVGKIHALTRRIVELWLIY